MASVGFVKGLSSGYLHLQWGARIVRQTIEAGTEAQVYLVMERKVSQPLSSWMVEELVSTPLDGRPAADSGELSLPSINTAIALDHGTSSELLGRWTREHDVLRA